MRKFIISLLFVHTVITLWLIKDHGFFIFLPPYAENYVYQIFSDLTVSLVLLMLFIYREVKQKQLPLWKFYAGFAVMLVLGSFGPLVYLICEPKIYDSKN